MKIMALVLLVFVAVALVGCGKSPEGISQEQLIARVRDNLQTEINKAKQEAVDAQEETPKALTRAEVAEAKAQQQAQQQQAAEVARLCDELQATRQNAQKLQSTVEKVFGQICDYLSAEQQLRLESLLRQGKIDEATDMVRQVEVARALFATKQSEQATPQQPQRLRSAPTAQPAPAES